MSASTPSGEMKMLPGAAGSATPADPPRAEPPRAEPKSADLARAETLRNVPVITPVEPVPARVAGTVPTRQLSELPRDELAHLAEEYGLDPSDYKSRQHLVAALPERRGHPVESAVAPAFRSAQGRVGESCGRVRPRPG